MRSMVVCARRWWERTNGNSYYTVRAIVDGQTVGVSDMTYGHGDTTYLHEAVGMARAAGVDVPADDWYGLRDAGWMVLIDAVEVERKRDLHARGRASLYGPDHRWD